ncbi:DNA mismatch repair protein MutS [Rhodomicrobium lacus]|uniref:DNA mismatch repair protein MutS n=1 Tax=Rhodomicrobium lacus TaxID=2498452 RepID=UPI0026E416F3|nr:DNA mismatch repair protein MutS [Rhodomicrobium lacus]WKW52167.1 DNA mismatch repair protein MutS [Rhodomicrobium lacus]
MSSIRQKGVAKANPGGHAEESCARTEQARRRPEARTSTDTEMRAPDTVSPETRATPMMAQYLDVKAKNPDFLLFYRMGDFFELFFDDAVKAASALGIQLTKRGKHAGEDIPMCGVPVARADDYMQKLILKGFRVAVAEQLEDPELAKKRGPKAVVRRDVVRLVTPGTLTEDALLVSGRNNFLVALAKTGKGAAARYHIAALDISTGEFLLSEASAPDLGGELLRLRPAEVLIAEDELGDEASKAAAEVSGAALSPLSRACFGRAKGERALREAFEVAALDGLGDFTDGDLTAIGALLHYVNLTQMGERPALRPPRRDEPARLMAIDAATRASLELVRPKNEGAPTVFSAIDRTVTAAGARELMSRLVSPSADASLVNERLDAVAALIEDWALRERIRHILKTAPDMSRALSRLKLKRGGPRDLGAIRDGLRAGSEVATLLAASPAQPAHLKEATTALAAFTGDELGGRLARKLDRALVSVVPLLTRDSGYIAAGFDAALDELRELASSSKIVLAKLQADYAARTGVKTLKIQYNNVFGYFIEVSPGQASALMSEPHSALFRHKQTLASAVRFTTDELAALESRILTAQGDALAREQTLFAELSDAVLEQEDAIARAAQALACLDCVGGLAEVAQAQNYVRPRVDTSRAFLVEGGRHPAVEQALVREGGAFIGNDCRLDGAGERAPGFLVVTGPNMAGKSTYLRQNALIAVLAQMGSYVPATSAHIGVADRLFARIGAADDLARGRSTFMVEMTETAAILNRATERSLVILDEIGRGTATFDGLSIAWAVLEHLHDETRCRGLVATHYHELTRLADDLPRAGNVRMAVTEWKDTIVFLHAVESGPANRSYGVQAAKLAGVPKQVVTRAKQILAQLEAGAGPHGPLTLPTDMPLFSAPAAHHAADAPHPVLERLGALDVDSLSPREALDLLYALKKDLQVTDATG